MPKKYTDEEYAALLPKKQVGVAVLLFNSKNELLIVKPDYREGWLVPGGVTDEDESPLHSAKSRGHRANSSRAPRNARAQKSSRRSGIRGRSPHAPG